MMWNDRLPLGNTLVTDRINSVAPNRLGAVYSALHEFWVARNASATRAASESNTVITRDAYSVIMFHHLPAVVIENDTARNPEELLEVLLQDSQTGGTDFDSALLAAEGLMSRQWTDDR